MEALERTAEKGLTRRINASTLAPERVLRRVSAGRWIKALQKPSPFADHIIGAILWMAREDHGLLEMEDELVARVPLKVVKFSGKFNKAL